MCYELLDLDSNSASLGICSVSRAILCQELNGPTLPPGQTFCVLVTQPSYLKFEENEDCVTSPGIVCVGG